MSDRDMMKLRGMFTDANPPTNRALARLLGIESWQPETLCDCHDGPHFEGTTPSRRYEPCGTCVSLLFEPDNTEVTAAQYRRFQHEQADAELPVEMNVQDRRRGGINAQKQSNRLMPPNLPRIDRKRFTYPYEKPGHMIEHKPVHRRNIDIVGLTCEQNCDLVPHMPGYQKATRFSMRECSAFVASGHAIWFIDYDAFGNVDWRRYLRPGMFWGDVGCRQCEAIAYEFGARNAKSHSKTGRDYAPFTQADIDDLFGNEAPAIGHMEGHIFADRWKVEAVGDAFIMTLSE